MVCPELQWRHLTNFAVSFHEFQLHKSFLSNKTLLDFNCLLFYPGGIHVISLKCEPSGLVVLRIS